ncbi:nuclear transport factor 2 family protein [candidate division KSB1 bacterium]|nr:nuclear transport factor 2 family protein [candidate division KSB1 bacterium]NIR69960.1 nuclear transport factor 2 family protein [candidate division KSB1 bacterium]NIS25859.1 nuclear transport factor 2 family protein [candidate division KSB1 bacterium]NIT72736.1 nuclear transport factor 2 family protein [candidate division KSB1 bacterium]NIU26548.1 nuclear transport factor 2 family protein [candidate division KSB1 bacterium]
MKRNRSMTSFVLICLLVLLVSALAGTRSSSDEEAIQGLISQCAQALQSQDWEMLDKVCSEDWLHISHMGDRWDMAAVKSFFEDHITDHTIQFSDVDTHISDDASMAWATFNEETEYNFDGNPVKQSAVFTATFEKQAKAWKMKLLHRTVVAQPDKE